MKRVIVCASVVLGLAAAVVATAAAQSVRVGATVRVSDDLVVGISYGRPYRAGVVVYDRFHPARVGHRNARLKHQRCHAAWERGHRELHRDMRRGHVSPREHRRWHEAAAFEHCHDHRVPAHARGHGHR